MATIRVEKRADYTVLSNACFDDERLSLKAVGLLGYMLRLPDDWNFTLEWLAGKHKDGLASIRSAMEELESAGYVTRGQSRQGGKFSKNEYIVRESPEETGTSSGASRHLPLKGKADGVGDPPSCENRMTAPPSCDFPITEKPITENRTLPNTKLPSTDISPYCPPEGDRPASRPQGESGGKQDVSLPQWKPERFSAFYDYYPKHVGRKAACKAWDKLKPSKELLYVMATTLRLQKQTVKWQEDGGRYVPDPATWLNGRRWEDEVKGPFVTEAMASEFGSNTQREEGHVRWI